MSFPLQTQGIFHNGFFKLNIEQRLNFPQIKTKNSAKLSMYREVALGIKWTFGQNETGYFCTWRFLEGALSILSGKYSIRVSAKQNLIFNKC